MNLAAAILVGKLSASGSGFSFDGEYAGRFGIGEFLGGLRSVGISSEWLCRGTETYKHVKTVLCGALDLALDPKQDLTGVPCNAISTAISIEATPAQMGRVWKPPPGPARCPDDVDAGFDSCE